MSFIKGSVASFFLLAFIYTNYQVSYSEEIIKWNADGEAISTAQGNQYSVVSTNVEPFGAIFVWVDGRDENHSSDIYGQRIDGNGQVCWQVNGIPLIVPEGEISYIHHTNPVIATSDANSAIFTWSDDREMQSNIYAQRIDINGDLKWQKNGIPIATACFLDGGCYNSKWTSQIISDGSGGAIITWHELRDGYNFSVWAQRVDKNGNVLWKINGIPIAFGEFYATFPQIVSDGNGGAYIAWWDNRVDLRPRIFAQHINASGISLWAENGLEISPPGASGGLNGFSIIADDFGGAVISWVDGRKNDSNDADIYAQRITGNGQTLWTENGVPVCTRQGHQYSPQLSTDKAGGAIIVWEDQGASPIGSGEQWLYAQHINRFGIIQWPLNGMPIYRHHSHNPRTISDNGGGAIVVWDTVEYIDPFNHIRKLMAQHVTRTGQMLWQEGFEVYSEEGGADPFAPKILNYDNGGAIIYWTNNNNI
jgi:hypothetical protein